MPHAHDRLIGPSHRRALIHIASVRRLGHDAGEDDREGHVAADAGVVASAILDRAVPAAPEHHRAIALVDRRDGLVQLVVEVRRVDEECAVLQPDQLKVAAGIDLAAGILGNANSVVTDRSGDEHL